MRRALAVLALVICSLGLVACGDEETPASDGGSEQEAKTINITIEGETLTPNGDRVEVKVGQPIELVVKSDAEGEIHVHSDPEQEFEYAAGTTTLIMAPITRPGIVEVESHELEKTIVQLEVK